VAPVVVSEGAVGAALGGPAGQFGIEVVDHQEGVGRHLQVVVEDCLGPEVQAEADLFLKLVEGQGLDAHGCTRGTRGGRAEPRNRRAHCCMGSAEKPHRIAPAGQGSVGTGIEQAVEEAVSLLDGKDLDAGPEGLGDGDLAGADGPDKGHQVVGAAKSDLRLLDGGGHGGRKGASVARRSPPLFAEGGTYGMALELAEDGEAGVPEGGPVPGGAALVEALRGAVCHGGDQREEAEAEGPGTEEGDRKSHETQQACALLIEVNEKSPCRLLDCS